MAVLSSAAMTRWSGFSSFVLREVVDTFSGNYADLTNAPTSDGSSSWSRISGTSFGTSAGRVNTSTTTDTIYQLNRDIKNFTMTANLYGSSGGDAFYFRIKDSGTWLRLRCYSTQGTTYNVCTYDQIPGYPYVYTVDAPNGPCFGNFYSQPEYAGYETLCGQQVLNYTNYVYEYRTDCFLSTPWKLLSYTMLGNTQYTQTRRDNTYFFVLEQSVNGAVSTISTRSIVRTEVTAVTLSQYFSSKITGALPNPYHTVTLTNNNDLVSYSVSSQALPSFTVSNSLTTSSNNQFSGVGIGRGNSSLYTASGIDDVKWVVA